MFSPFYMFTIFHKIALFILERVNNHSHHLHTLRDIYAKFRLHKALPFMPLTPMSPSFGQLSVR